MVAFCGHMLKVMLWDALRLLLLGVIRSKRSVEAGWVDVGTSLNRSGMAAGAVTARGLVQEKAFQSPNSPLPVDREPEEIQSIRTIKQTNKEKTHTYHRSNIWVSEK